MQALMKSKAIVILFEGFSFPLQIRFLPEQHVIQIFSTDGANQSFDEGVGHRHARKSVNLVDSQDSQIRLPLVDPEPDDPTSALVHDDEDPMGFKSKRRTPKKIDAPQTVVYVANEGQP